jgi:hypothetical protein
MDAYKDEAGGDVDLQEVVRFVQALVRRVDYDGARVVSSKGVRDDLGMPRGIRRCACS